MGCYIVILPFLLLSSLFFLYMNWSAFLILTELTWDVVFSMQMVLGIFMWLAICFLPTYIVLLWTYQSIVQLFAVQEPMLVLTPDGLYHRNFASFNEESIAWSDIESIWVRPRYPNRKHPSLYFCITLKPTHAASDSVVRVEFESVKCEEYTLYQNVLKYWRQYRGDHWQGNPNIAETGWPC